MPFNVNPENVPSGLHLEIIELQCKSNLKQQFLILIGLISINLCKKMNLKS